MEGLQLTPLGFPASATPTRTGREGKASPESISIPYPPRVVSGIQPLPEIHLGHYFGAILQHLDLHHEYPGQAFVLIADYHSLTRNDAEWVRRGTLEIATAYLALGLDPEKARLYLQSDVPEVTELAWILSCQLSMGRFAKLHGKRPSAGGNGHRTLGSYAYPVLMAADILALQGSVVPEAFDQSPNIELTRMIARAFNEKCRRDFFPLPEIRRHSLSGFVPGTDGRKMHSRAGNTIGVFDGFDALREKLSRIDAGGGDGAEGRDPESSALYRLYTLTAPLEEIPAFRRKFTGADGGPEEARRGLLFALQARFGGAGEKYRKLKDDPDFVRDVLREGVKSVRQIARHTVDEIRKLVGFSF